MPYMYNNLYKAPIEVEGDKNILNLRVKVTTCFCLVKGECLGKEMVHIVGAFAVVFTTRIGVSIWRPFAYNSVSAILVSRHFYGCKSFGWFGAESCLWFLNKKWNIVRFTNRSHLNITQNKIWKMKYRHICYLFIEVYGWLVVYVQLNKQILKLR